ncbi:hypothetical protein L9W92_10020 [Pelotomaculum terephthalicicum JT]|uniref:hypothetical protein n=1 Tax=Pelotomaculum terephthalicicum TaxID=206393 RepID=UPI001F041D05|nr:hypothetical protein [Pelotomaculum terephthalicicum]MCG9968389.1 hypothetical protein [Pelotomaculum terephthalicicum JT]
MKDEKILIKILYLALLICVVYIFTFDLPEYVIGPIHGGALFNFIYQISIGYIVSFIFFKLINHIFQKREESLKKELLKNLYRMLVKRLCECTTDIEMKFQLIDQVKGSGFKYHTNLFSAFELKQEGHEGLKHLYEAMKDYDIKKYSKFHSDPQIAYEKSLSDIAIELYETTDFKVRFSEILSLIPQIVYYETDFLIKDTLHKLGENISDTRESINGHKEMNTGSVYPHMLRFVDHIITIYGLLLNAYEDIKIHYQS